jgi:murein L,D-transpeptidase YcbB/YkuD
LASRCSTEPDTVRTSGPRLHTNREIKILIANRGRGLGLADTAVVESTWSVVSEIYERRHHRPIWSKGQRLRPEAMRLLEALRHAPDAGLDSTALEVAGLDQLMDKALAPGLATQRVRPRTLARFDVLATYAELRASEQLQGGRVPRAALDSDWAPDKSASIDADEFERSISGDPVALFGNLEPRHDGYVRLRQALAQYRAIATRGGWPEIAAGPPLRRGDRGIRVASAMRRLLASGDLDGPVRDIVYDRRVEEAVGDLQSRLGIPRSGILGEATRSALNVPVERRIRQMELNLERWRWLPDSLGRRRLEVNVPAYQLELIRDGRVTRTMRVVVGSRKSPTPMFSDHVTYLEVNPTWTLPPHVVEKEIVPAMKRQADYLARNHMTVICIADAKRDTVRPETVPWKDAGSDSFPYLVIQDAGPENPLGQIKLMCPNEYDVYLHDTPARAKFSDAVRDYSHGCVRLENAIELADSLLGAMPSDTMRIDSLVGSGLWRRVRLPEPIPVHFLYWTVWVDEAGRLHFRDDVYGLDQRLDEALRSRSTDRFVLNPDVQVSAFWLAAEAKAREAAEARARQLAARPRSRPRPRGTVATR